MKWKQDPNDLFVLIIVLYGVNTLVFVLLYEHDVHLNYELYNSIGVSREGRVCRNCRSEEVENVEH